MSPLTLALIQWLFLSASGFDTSAAPSTVEASRQRYELLSSYFRDFDAKASPLIQGKNLAGLEDLARHTQLEWMQGDPEIYRGLMVKAADSFRSFPIASGDRTRLAIEFQEISRQRSGELGISDELFILGRNPQNWEEVEKVSPGAVTALREKEAERVLNAWQRAEDAWDQIKDRPVMAPPVLDNTESVIFSTGKDGRRIIARAAAPEDSKPGEASTSGATEYNFYWGLKGARVDFSNGPPGNVAWGFAISPVDFGRFASLTEQLLTKAASRDAFYASASRGIPPNLLPQFQAVVRETQERRKAHLRTPSAPMIREHTNRPFASPASRGSNPVPNQTAGKQVPAARTPIIAAASPAPSASEAAQSTSPRSLPYLPLASVLAAGVVLWWFISRSRPG